VIDVLELTYAAGLTVERNVPIGPYTSLKIGGPADFFVRARGAGELSRCLTAAHRLGVPWLLVGGGSNMLVSDHGFRGLAIKVERPAGQRNSAEVLRETEHDVVLRCDAGVLTAGLARWTASLGWTGLEWACGVPGTVGGAVAGNAGAYGGDMAALVQRVRAWLPDGERAFEAAGIGYGYRASRFKRAAVPCAVLEADLKLARGSAAAAVTRIEANERNRLEKQPRERSCGSVFKNPYPQFAGQLVEQAGLKGTAVGGAQISEKHGNFFVNKGGATATDVVRLIRTARARVEEREGVRLAVEILLAGDWAPEEIADL
jgi:UDP-N-acetylmuramate dehydrogenase